MARPDINITQCSDGLDPIATSLYPLGDRPANASNLVYSGSTAHNGVARISTLGGVSVFGASAATLHSEFNGAFYSNGISVPLASSWGTMTATRETTGLRHANVGSMYRGLGEGVVTNAYNIDTLPASNKKLAFNYHSKIGSAFVKSYVGKIDTSTGTLAYGTNRSRGELCTLLLSAGGTIQCYATFQDATYVTIELLPIYSASVSQIYGSTITGLTSGFVVTIVADTGQSTAADLGGTKWNRMFHGGVSSGARSLIVPKHVSGTSVGYGTYTSGEVYTSNELQNLWTPIVNTWLFHEHIIDLNTGAYHWKINGTDILSTTLSPINFGAIGLRPTLIGLDTAGLSGIPYSSVGLLQEFDSIYIHNDLNYMILTDNAVYASSTKFEPLMHTAWNTSGIDFVLNRGEITSGGYVHIFKNGTWLTSVGVA